MATERRHVHQKSKNDSQPQREPAYEFDQRIAWSPSTSTRRRGGPWDRSRRLRADPSHAAHFPDWPPRRQPWRLPTVNQRRSRRSTPPVTRAAPVSYRRVIAKAQMERELMAFEQITELLPPAHRCWRKKLPVAGINTAPSIRLRVRISAAFYTRLRAPTCRWPVAEGASVPRSTCPN